MARPKGSPYTLGKIAYSAHPTKPGQWQARGYYLNAGLARREVTASGKTQAAAKRALDRKVNDARDEHRGGNKQLNQDTKVPAAAAVWLDWKAREQLRASTLTEYQGYVRRSIDNGDLSSLTISQANDVSRIESWLTGIADEHGEAAAKQSRKVLGGVLKLAERRGAIKASVMHRVETPRAKPGSSGDRKCADPECDLDCGKRHLDTRRAFTQDEAAGVLNAADNATADIGDLAHFLFGTGVRISEALHCTSWSDVDLDAQKVRVRGTKTAQADRTLGLSDDLTQRLRKRAEIYGTDGLVFGVTRFHAKVGQPRDRNNVSKSLRRVFAKAGVPWAGTHTFRRTVATWMDDAGHSLASIANQLGHADTNVTAKYLGRQDAATHAATVMVLPAATGTKRGHLRAVSGE